MESENGVVLTKTQKARVKWLESLGCRIGVDFEVGGDGLFIYAAEEYVDWQELAKVERRKEIEEMIKVFGCKEVVEYDAETKAALAEELEPAGHLHIGNVVDQRAPSLKELESQADYIEGLLNPHIGTGNEDHVMEEVVAAQLEAMIQPMIEALAQEPVMEPEAAREEPIFVVTNNGVLLSKGFRKIIAEKTKELFGQEEDVPTLLQRLCLEKWGISRKTQRASFAVKLYSAAVIRSLQAQTRNGASLRVNSYWA